MKLKLARRTSWAKADGCWWKGLYCGDEDGAASIFLFGGGEVIVVEVRCLRWRRNARRKRRDSGFVMTRSDARVASTDRGMDAKSTWSTS